MHARPSALNPSSRFVLLRQKEKRAQHLLPPPLRARVVRAHLDPRNETRRVRARRRIAVGGPRRRRRASPRPGARRERRPTRARARAPSAAASRSASVMIFWFTGAACALFRFCVYAFAFVRSREERACASAPTRSHFFAFRVEASDARFPSRHPRLPRALPRVPEHQAPPIASAASDGGDRSTATVGVISAVTPSQYPGSLRPTRADASRRCAPAHRDAREPKTSPCASARTFRREARAPGRRDARARRRRGERCRETGHGDRSVCGTKRPRRRALLTRVGVTMTLS